MEVSQSTIIQNRYRLLRKLGRGSFGEVWAAHDDVADLEVAIKIYVALDDRGIEEFRTEFRTVSTLIHTNILRPEHYDVYDSRPYLVMPLCRGSVEERVGGMSEPELWHFIRDVSSGLAYLHGHEILHRDIKPDNILVNPDGDYVVSDFGISTRMRSTMRRSSMRQDKGMDTSGTIAYMAPELFTKSPSAVKATDIWALGATLYELMTGELLFFGQGGVVQLKGAELPELPEIYSKDLRDTVASCLNLDTWLRPTATELSEYAVSRLKGETVRMPWKDRKGGSDERIHAGSDPHRIESAVRPLSEDAGIRPEQPHPKSSKKKWVWLTLLLLLVVCGSLAGYKLDQNKSTDVTHHYVGDNNDDTGVQHGREWVDLGLSVLWATCNVGASSPSDYGNYYAWGETTTKSSYTKASSRTYEVSMGNISGNTRYDAATANWGGGWRMPTKVEFEELVDRCNWQWTSQGDRNGYRVIGPNGNSIFLPAAGLRYETLLIGEDEQCLYWSSTPYGSDAQYAYYLLSFSGGHDVSYVSRYKGRSVRPVLDK